VKTYTVHEPPNPPANQVERAEGMVFVRDGFSWSALFFGPVWLLAKRMWIPLIFYVAVVTIISVVFGVIGLGGTFTGWIVAALHVLLALEGSTLQRWSLEQRRWTMIGSVQGRTESDGERRFFEAWLDDRLVEAGRLSPQPAFSGLSEPAPAGWFARLWR
jgi:hypothetical protein